MRDLKHLNEVRIYNAKGKLIRTIMAKRLEDGEGLKDKRILERKLSGLVKARARSLLIRKLPTKPKGSAGKPPKK